MGDVECPYCVPDGQESYDTRMERSACGFCGGTGRFVFSGRPYDTRKGGKPTDQIGVDRDH
jgi:hypothetical protein